MMPDYQLGELGGRRPVLTLREVRLDDLPIFRRWRSDPRYASMLRRPGTPTTHEDAVEWYRSNLNREWWSVWSNGGGLTTLRGYVMLTPHGMGVAEISVLTDPDAPCDADALLLLVAKAIELGYDRLIAETYTRERENLVMRAEFVPVQYWTRLLRRDGPATPPVSPAGGSA